MNEKFKEGFLKTAIIGAIAKAPFKMLGLTGPLGMVFGGMTALDTVQKTRAATANTGSMMNIPSSFYGTRTPR